MSQERKISLHDVPVRVPQGSGMAPVQGGAFFLLDRIDGISTVLELSALAGMTLDEVTRHLGELVQLGRIEIVPADSPDDSGSDLAAQFEQIVAEMSDLDMRQATRANPAASARAAAQARLTPHHSSTVSESWWPDDSDNASSRDRQANMPATRPVATINVSDADFGFDDQPIPPASRRSTSPGMRMPRAPSLESSGSRRLPRPSADVTAPRPAVTSGMRRLALVGDDTEPVTHPVDDATGPVQPLLPGRNDDVTAERPAVVQHAGVPPHRPWVGYTVPDELRRRAPQLSDEELRMIAWYDVHLADLDYYDLLEINHAASNVEITASMAALRRRLGDARWSGRDVTPIQPILDRINRALERAAGVLTDPAARAGYDAVLSSLKGS